MIRDITMIVSVLISVVSFGFGVYQGIESRNARAFAYEQFYRVLSIVQDSNITPFQKAVIADAALSVLTEPPSVLDLSRSSADVGSAQTCAETTKSTCTTLASELARANKYCSKGDQISCTSAENLQRQIVSQNCISCFNE